MKVIQLTLINVISRSFILFLLLLPLLSFSQNESYGTVKGLITEKETGDPLIGANIYLKKDFTIGTTTDIDGKYSLILEVGTYLIVYSFTGMKSEQREIKIEAEKEITINIF